MKNKIVLFLVALATLFTLSARSQIFIGGVTIVGNTNAVMLNNYIPITNLFYTSLPSRTLVIQNVQTNSIVTVNYGYQWAGLGGTNLFIQNTFTTNFNQTAGFTNGSTCIIQLPAIQNAVPLQTWGTYQCTNALGNVTNIVSLY